MRDGRCLIRVQALHSVHQPLETLFTQLAEQGGRVDHIKELVLVPVCRVRVRVVVVVVMMVYIHQMT